MFGPGLIGQGVDITGVLFYFSFLKIPRMFLFRSSTGNTTAEDRHDDKKVYEIFFQEVFKNKKLLIHQSC